MGKAVQEDSANRDFDSISPSAKSLLLLKGVTNIPFAREAAELMSFPEKYNPGIYNEDSNFWKKVVHFENRYWSIDQLLQGLSIKNILELSSGFSFRGLATIQQNDFHYIDTDLPNIIITKKEFLGKIEKSNNNPKGKLEIIPLNALDEKQFTDTVTHFPAGEIFIVNEGLLVYLNTEEKEKLCSIIHTILKLRGGYWITADIYIKTRTGKSSLIADDNLKQFLEQHRIEDNKFDSFEAAEAFFKKAGFVVDKEARPDHLKLSSLQHLLKSMTEKQIAEMRNTPKFRATWRLKAASL